METAIAVDGVESDIDVADQLGQPVAAQLNRINRALSAPVVAPTGDALPSAAGACASPGVTMLVDHRVCLSRLTPAPRQGIRRCTP